jgi:hypothetical protein
VTGVSGSGKSTLVSQVLVDLVGAALGQGAGDEEGDDAMDLEREADIPTVGHIAGALHGIRRLVRVDQKPIGRTPRSNLATYTGLFDQVRKLFAATPAAKKRRYDAGRFSFNVAKGRCEHCAGEGFVMVELLFLPSVYAPCPTCGGNDLERSTELARKMVCEWGMSDAMGPLTFGKKEEQIFLGREIAQHQDYSEDTAIRIDHEIKRMVTENYERAKTLLEKHKVALEQIADALLAREVLDADQVRRIIDGLPLEEMKPAAPPVAANEETRKTPKERQPIVPALPPLNKPVPQE